jgi:hypothetical protein
MNGIELVVVMNSMFLLGMGVGMITKLLDRAEKQRRYHD